MVSKIKTLIDRWANISVTLEIMSSLTHLILVWILVLTFSLTTTEDLGGFLFFVLFFPSSVVVWDLQYTYIFVPNLWVWGLDNWNKTIELSEGGQLWSTGAAWMNSSSMVMPDIPPDTKHSLTHVLQMRHLKHFGYSVLSLPISFSHLLQDIQHILAGWG